MYTYRKVILCVDVYLLLLATSPTSHRSIPAHQPWGTVLQQAPLMGLGHLTSLKVQVQSTSHGSLAAFTVQVYKYPPSCLELFSECVFVVLPRC